MLNQVNLKTRVGRIKKDQEKLHLIDDKENNLGVYDFVIIAITAGKRFAGGISKNFSANKRCQIIKI